MLIRETKKVLLEGLDSGKFLSAVALSHVDELSSDSKSLSLALSELHNDSIIDLNEQFSCLSRQDEQHDFFTLLHVYQTVLPMLTSPASDVVKCIGNLLEQAGNDLAIDGVYGSFVNFCGKDLQRSQEALDVIICDTKRLVSLASETIIAASDLDSSWSLKQVVNLIGHEEPSLRRQAYLALGRMAFTLEQEIEFVFSKLEIAAESEPDDLVKGGILRALIALGKKQNSLWERRFSS